VPKKRSIFPLPRGYLANPDHPHITHHNPATTLQYIHLSGRDLSTKLANGMAQIHAWRVAQLANAPGTRP
jgi:hypothetical protein